MEVPIRELINLTADRTLEAIVVNASITIERIEKEYGKEVADRLQGYVMDAAMGAAQRVAEVFLTEAPDQPRPAELEEVAKLASDRIDERLASDYLPQLKGMLGIDVNAS